jgi:hypothetical protein
MARTNKASISTGSTNAAVGLIVEGETEFYALPQLKRIFHDRCPALKLINLGGVGSTLTPVAIAKMVAGKIKVLIAAGCRRVVVCIDREQRPECAGQFAESVYLALGGQLASSDQCRVSIVVADRTFEAWILADAAGLYARGEFKEKLKRHCFEGELGAQGKKGTIELSTLLGRQYEKTRDGPRLFAKVDFSVARTYGPGRRGSRSLDKFLRTLRL